MGHIGRNHVDFTAADEASIVQMLSERMTLPEVAAKMDCGIKPIKRVALKHGVKLTTARSAFSPAQELEVLQLIAQQVPMPEIARRYGRNHKSVARVAALHGVTPNARAFRPSASESAQLVARYLAGEPFQQMAREIGVWGDTLRKHLVEQGVTIRSNKTDSAKEDLIVHDYVHGGLTICNITDKHGVTDKVVWRLVKERSLVREVPAKPRPSCHKGPFYDRWLKLYGKEGADRRKEEHRALCSKNSRGANNPMYGKPTPQGSGNGWKGWHKGHFFRSLRELTFMLELEERGVQWVNGEKGAYRVRYVDPNGAERTYAPDYVVLDEAMYEIKPKRLWASPLVTAKRLAAEVLCVKLGIEYRLVDPKLDGEKLKALHVAGGIKWWGQCEAKFLAYYELAA